MDPEYGNFHSGLFNADDNNTSETNSKYNFILSILEQDEHYHKPIEFYNTPPFTNPQF